MDETGWPVFVTRMILCPECGNKRCPKATDHMLDCTESNEARQPGSLWSPFNYRLGAA